MTPILKSLRYRLACLTMFLLAALGPAAMAETDVSDAILAQIQEFQTARSTSSREIAAGALIAQIYEQIHYQAAWSELAQIRRLVDAVAATGAEGLNPDDYEMRRLNDALQVLESARMIAPDERARIDLRLTDSLVRLVYHLRLGKTESQTGQPRWQLSGLVNGADPVQLIVELIQSSAFAEVLAGVAPRSAAYRRLQSALARYQGIRDAGGWSAIPDGPTLRSGMTDDRVSALVRRLMMVGDLDHSYAVVNKEVYVDEVADAVRRFQERHGLDNDSVVGRRTLRALNVSAAARVEQLRLNLERERRVQDAPANEFVLVNIASFRAFHIRNKEIAWSAPVQVGDRDHLTPELAASIERIIVNPAWTVPWSIATEELLPEIRNNTAYLSENNFDVFDRSGVRVDPLNIDWTMLNRRNFNYTLIQRPGPGNALGNVKFEFPNADSVYLHDTPHKANFERAKRAFSHGCIRLQAPLELARILLLDDGWNDESVEDLFAETMTRAVRLTRSVPILVRYRTAEVDADGLVFFYDDVYQQDAELLLALNTAYLDWYAQNSSIL